MTVSNVSISSSDDTDGLTPYQMYISNLSSSTLESSSPQNQSWNAHSTPASNSIGSQQQQQQQQQQHEEAGVSAGASQKILLGSAHPHGYVGNGDSVITKDPVVAMSTNQPQGSWKNVLSPNGVGSGGDASAVAVRGGWKAGVSAPLSQRGTNLGIPQPLPPRKPYGGAQNAWVAMGSSSSGSAVKTINVGSKGSTLRGASNGRQAQTVQVQQQHIGAGGRATKDASTARRQQQQQQQQGRQSLRRSAVDENNRQSRSSSNGGRNGKQGSSSSSQDGWEEVPRGGGARGVAPHHTNSAGGGMASSQQSNAYSFRKFHEDFESDEDEDEDEDEEDLDDGTESEERRSENTDAASSSSSSASASGDAMALSGHHNGIGKDNRSTSKGSGRGKQTRDRNSHGVKRQTVPQSSRNSDFTAQASSTGAVNISNPGSSSNRVASSNSTAPIVSKNSKDHANYSRSSASSLIRENIEADISSTVNDDKSEAASSSATFTSSGSNGTGKAIVNDKSKASSSSIQLFSLLPKAFSIMANALRQSGVVPFVSLFLSQAVSLVVCLGGFLVAGALVVLLLLLELHKYALREVSSNYPIAFCFAFPYFFSYLISCISDFAPHWGAVCLWYSFLVQLLCTTDSSAKNNSSGPISSDEAPDEAEAEYSFDSSEKVPLGNKQVGTRVGNSKHAVGSLESSPRIRSARSSLSTSQLTKQPVSSRGSSIIRGDHSSNNRNRNQIVYETKSTISSESTDSSNNTGSVTNSNSWTTLMLRLLLSLAFVAESTTTRCYLLDMSGVELILFSFVLGVSIFEYSFHP